MTIALANVLWYWDAARGLLTPTIGGQPTFNREGSAFSKQIEGHHLILGYDTPRFEPDGLRLELSQVNKVADPFDVDHAGANWARDSSNLTSVDAVSIYDGEIAQKTSDAGTGNIIRQTVGVLTGSPETCHADLEFVDSPTAWLIFYDQGATDNVQRIILTFSTGGVADGGSGAGSAESFGSIKLADVGPNGGVVYRVWLTATPNTPSNARSIRVMPSPAGSTSTIIHAVQHVESGTVGSPVEGTRAPESFYWSNAPLPQASIWYLKMRAVAENDSSGDKGLVIGNSTDADSLSISFNNPTNLEGLMREGGVNRSNAITSMTVVPGDLIELVLVLNSNNTLRLIGRQNSGAVVANEATSATSLPSAWTNPELSLNSNKDTTLKGTGLYQQLKTVTLASVDSATDGTGDGDEDLMAEMAGLYVSPDGQRVSNTV